MNKTTTTLLILLTAFAAISIYRMIATSDYIAPGQVDEMIDENTRALSAQVRSLEEIRDSIRAVSSAQADRIQELQEEILVYTGIEGRLNIYKDSLQTLNNRILLTDLFPTPTVESRDSGSTVGYKGTDPESREAVRLSGNQGAILTTQTFTDSLFLVSSTLTVDPPYLYNNLDLKQLRPIDIRFTVTENRAGQLTLYTYLPDFDASEQYVWSPPRKKETHWLRRHWREATIIAAGAYILLLD